MVHRNIKLDPFYDILWYSNMHLHKQNDLFKCSTFIDDENNFFPFNILFFSPELKHGRKKGDSWKLRNF